MYNRKSAGQEPAPSRRFEISAILLCALGALALVSLFSDAAGVVGTTLSAVLRYLFGQLAWVPPVLLIVHAVLSLRQGEHVHYTRRALAVLSFYVLGLIVIHLWLGRPVGFRWSDLRSFSPDQPGGGIVGALLGQLLVGAVGRGGSWVVIAAWAAVSAVLVSNTPVSRRVAGVFEALRRLVHGIGLGWSDFWRGVRMELVELAGMIRDRRELRRAAPAGRVRAERPSERRRRERSVAAPPDDARTVHAAVQEAASVQAEDADVSEVYDPVNLALPWRTPPDGAVVPIEEPEPVPVPEEEAPPVAHATEAPPAAAEAAEPGPLYRLPPLALLDRPRGMRRSGREEPDQSAQLEETLARFGIEAKVVHVSRGPAVTRYELQPAPGVKVKQITSLADDLALALAAAGIRIEAPVPGKSVVGIEVPNKETAPVYLREVLESDAFQNSDSKLTVALGKDITGEPVVADLRRLLHVLIAGATGSGKSVCINSIIVSLLYRALPDEVKLLMVDPKRVELAVYDGIPHLVTPVVTDPKQAAGALRWAVKEMESRYARFSQVGVRNIDGYNRWVEAQRQNDAGDGTAPDLLPYIVIIIDELADLMMVAQHDVEDSICRLAQMARAAGLHLIIATQRPSVDVITGLIKANVPSRVAFAVSSSHDSRTILDMVGAERLLGKGDLLYYPAGSNKPTRAQGAYVSDREVQEVVNFWKAQGAPIYEEAVVAAESAGEAADEVDDELFEDAVRLVMDTESASISMLQRRFRIGYARAARLIDMMEQRGIVGPYQGSKPREVLRRSLDGDS